MRIFFDDIKSMLKVERGTFKRKDLVALFAEQERPLRDQEVDIILKGICDNGVVKLRGKVSLSLFTHFVGFLDRLTRQSNLNE